MSTKKLHKIVPLLSSSFELSSSVLASAFGSRTFHGPDAELAFLPSPSSEIRFVSSS